MTHHPFRFGIVSGGAESADAWINLAKRAEDLGYASLLMPDTLGPTLAPLPALAVAAASTTTLHAGTWVVANDLRNPVLLAREAATLGFLTGGRFDLGIGPGRAGVEREFPNIGIADQGASARVDRLEEALAIISGLLRSGRVDHAGVHFTARDVTLYPPLGDATRPRLLVSAAGPRMRRLAARYADTIALGIGPTETPAQLRERLATIRQAAGDRFDQIELAINLSAVGEEVHPSVRQWLKLDDAALRQSQSPTMLLGTVDEMVAQLQRTREEFGISCIAVADSFMASLAPVIARLAGK